MLLNLLLINPSDDQGTVVDAINYNFDQILSMGGGPPGNPGIQGIQGVPGPQGIQGSQGVPGTPGSKWYVQPLADVPAIPVPVAGDFWFQTDTLLVYEFEGSPLSWVLVGNLSVALSGPFAYSGNPAITNNILFSNPTNQRSLVLSSVNYGAGNDSPGTPNYRLKLVGATGNPLVRFGLNNGGVELSEVYQPNIAMQQVSSNQYDWNFDNGASNQGNINVIGAGTSLQLQAQAAGISNFNFNSTSFALQLGSTDKVAAFSTSIGGGVRFHVGVSGAIGTSTYRLFTVSDDGSTGVGDVYTNPISDAGGMIPTTTYYALDVLGPVNTIGNSAAFTANKIARFRNKIVYNWDELDVIQMKTFTGSAAQAYGGTEMRIQRFIDTDPSYHFISYHSGMYNTSLVQNVRPQIRFGNGFGADSNGVADGYYMSTDVNGYMGLASSPFISMYNDAGTQYHFQDRLNVLSPNSTANNLYAGGGFYQGSTTSGQSFGGIHLFVPQASYNGVPGDTVSDIAGLTIGNPLGARMDQNYTSAGLMFQTQNVGTNMFLATSPIAGTQSQTRTAIRYDGLQWMGSTPLVAGPLPAPNPTWTFTESGFVFSPSYQGTPPTVLGAGGTKGLTYLTQNPSWASGYSGLYNHFTFDSGYGVGMELIHYISTSVGIVGGGDWLVNPAFIITSDWNVTGVSPSHHRTTTFLVDAYGNTAIGGDLLQQIVPVTNGEWATYLSTLALRGQGQGEGLGSLTLSTFQPGGGVPTDSNTAHIVTSNWSFVQNSPLFGGNLSINPGITQNLHAGQPATGGNLFLHGGKGENSVGTLSNWGNTVIGWDLPTAAQAGQVMVGTDTPTPFATMTVGGNGLSVTGALVVGGQTESDGGYRVAQTGTITIGSNSTGTVTHSLGYIPMVQFVPNTFGNVAFYLSALSTSIFSIYNNSGTGITFTYYLW